MRRYIVASHGTFAEGIVSSVGIIVGKIDGLYTVNAYVKEKETSDILKETNQIIDLHKEDEWIIMTDLLGGSVNTELMTLLNKPNIHIIAGINLGLLLTILLADQEENTQNLINRAVLDSRDGIKYCNDLFIMNEEDF